MSAIASAIVFFVLVRDHRLIFPWNGKDDVSTDQGISALFNMAWLALTFYLILKGIS